MKIMSLPVHGEDVIETKCYSKRCCEQRVARGWRDLRTYLQNNK